MIKRPIFLTIWLTIMTLGAVFSFIIYTFGATNLASVYPNSPTWTATLYTGLSLVNLIAAILLWYWKKFGFYIFIGSTIIASSINGMTMGVTGMFTSILAGLGIIILYLAMKPVWARFK